MASALQSAVTGIQLNNYTTVVTIAAVGYDYILTFPDEIRYIWSKPWTWVSTLFILARYFGLSYVMIFAFLGSSFFPGPEKTYVSMPHPELMTDMPIDYILIVVSNGLYIYGIWATLIFIAAADVAMILRVWAIYNRSKPLLGILATLCVAEIILGLVPCIMSTAQNTVVITSQLLDFSFCVADYVIPVVPKIAAVVQMTLGILMCLLFATQFVIQSLQAYKSTKRIRLNRYVSLFVKEGMVYFLCVLAYSLINLLDYTTNITMDEWSILLAIAQVVPTFTLVPRFILNLRALYARDSRGRREDNCLDTAFGLTSASEHGAAASMIMFVDGEQSKDEEGSREEIEMGEPIYGQSGDG